MARAIDGSREGEGWAFGLERSNTLSLRGFPVIMAAPDPHSRPEVAIGLPSLRCQYGVDRRCLRRVWTSDRTGYHRARGDADPQA
jgi:hypothetical protein